MLGSKEEKKTSLSLKGYVFMPNQTYSNIQTKCVPEAAAAMLE